MASEASSPIVDLLGPTLLSASGDTSTESVKAKYVGLYFSAHWCPPCKMFTPMLAAFYTKFKAAHPGDLEIVFISSDKSEGEFASYFASMPWLALPFSDRARKGELSGTFGVSGIPTFIILDDKGNIVTKDARSSVMEDPEGAAFPWRERTIKELMADPEFELVDKSNARVSGDSVSSADYVGFYFSAHWCPPCRAFTPKLAEFYTAMKAKGEHNFEIVFISGDRDPSQFAEYAGEMPWKALDFKHRGLAAAFNKAFNVEGIPSLQFVDMKTGEISVSDGRSRVTGDPEGFPWPPKPVELLSNSIDHINSDLMAVLFVDNMTDADQQRALTAKYTEIATPYFEARQSGGKKLYFAVATSEDEMTPNVRQFTGMLRDRSDARLIVLSIQTGKKFVLEHGGSAPTGDEIEAFIASVAAGSAPAVGVKDKVV